MHHASFEVTWPQGGHHCDHENLIDSLLLQLLVRKMFHEVFLWLDLLHQVFQAELFKLGQLHSAYPVSLEGFLLSREDVVQKTRGRLVVRG